MTQELPRPKIGFVGFGEVNTPKEIIRMKSDWAKKLLCSSGLDVVGGEPVSDDPAGVEAQRAIAELEREKLDLLVICIAGWIPSHTVIRVVSEFKHLPILLWGLSGRMQEHRLVTTADQAGTTALRQTMEELGFQFKYVPSFMDAPPPLDKITSFAHAASARKRLLNSRVGMMGNRDMNLYATLYDGVSLRKHIGVEIEFFDMLEMVQRSEQIAPEAIGLLVDKILQRWTFEKPIGREVLERGARYYLAIREKSLERDYQAVSLNDVDGMKRLLQFPPAMIFMLLADDLRVCTIPENDALGAATQLIVRSLTGQIGAYLEFYEFFSNGALMGVPDYVPCEIVDGPVRVTPSSFGELAGGLLNVSRVKTGPVTLCRIAKCRERYRMHIAIGNAIEPMAWEEAGWAPPAPQLPGIRFVLDGDMEQFSQNVMGQHYILSFGNTTDLLREFCKLADIEVVA